MPVSHLDAAAVPCPHVDRLVGHGRDLLILCRCLGAGQLLWRGLDPVHPLGSPAYVARVAERDPQVPSLAPDRRDVNGAVVAHLCTHDPAGKGSLMSQLFLRGGW